MIEKIHYDDYNKLNLNQRPPPDLLKYEINNQQGTSQKQLNNNPIYFNHLFSDLSEEDSQGKDRKEEEKNQDIKRNSLEKSEESEIDEKENQNYFPSKNFYVNNYQFHNDIINLPEDNIDNTLDYKLENITTIIDKNANVTQNLNDDGNTNMDININFPQYKNRFTEIINNNIKGNENEKNISKKRRREKNKIAKCKKRCIKRYIEYFIKYLKKYINKLIKKSKLQNNFHNDKLLSTASTFISLLIDEDNSNILSFNVKDIFCYKKKNLKNDSQINNEKYINNLLNYIKEQLYKDKKNSENIISFFNMNIQDACALFEKSREFKHYMINQEIIKYNKEFKQKFGYCLIEKNGFIKIMKNNENIDCREG